MARTSKIAIAKNNLKNITKKKRKQNLETLQKAMAYGDEPQFRGRITFREYLITYLNWANVMFDTDTLKQHFVEYAKNNNYNLSFVKEIPAYYFNTLGKIAYLLNNSRLVTEDVMESFDKAHFKLIEDYTYHLENQRHESVDEEKVTAEDRYKFQYWNLYSELDRLYGKSKESILEVFTKTKPPIPVLKHLHEHYSELIVQHPKTDKIGKFIQMVLDTVNEQMNTATIIKQSNRKPRKARIKKEAPAAKLVQKLNYMKQDDSIGMVSINPEAIIGAKSILIFNTTTRKFGIFHAKDHTGLSVKGTTLLNYDETKSVSKTIRKPTEQLPQLISASLARVSVLMKDIKAVETQLKGRINEDILILKAFK